MSTKYLLSVVCLCVLASVRTWAQDDPFGSGADPFADSGEVAPSKSVKARPPAKSKTRARMAERPLTSEVEARLHASLADETAQSFVETPLAEALQAISQTHDVPIVLDQRALEEIGLTPDAPVTLSLKNVTLRSFLRLMLRDLDLTYMIKDGVFQITTVEMAEQNTLLKMYVFPKGLVGKSEQLVVALHATVQSDTWKPSGGPSTVVPIENILVVSANAYVHDQVEEFLIKLDEAYAKSEAENK